jgi:hypothetical protein
MLRIALALTLLTAVPASAQVMDFAPFDEGPQDPSFVAFRDSLRFALAVNDTAWVFAHTEEGVFNGFGGSGGIEELREVYWEWTRLDLMAALSLGGYFAPEEWLEGDAEERFTAPYTNNFPEAPADWDWDLADWDFSAGAITVDGTAVVDEPGGEVLAVLGHVIVPITEWWSPVNPEDIQEPVWVEIQLADGRRGSVPAANINGSVGFRCFFEKRDGRWWFTGWAAGD